MSRAIPAGLIALFALGVGRRAVDRRNKCRADSGRRA